MVSNYILESGNCNRNWDAEENMFIKIMKVEKYYAPHGGIQFCLTILGKVNQFFSKLEEEFM